MESPVIAHDRRMLSLTLPNAFLERVGGGMLWAEGPVYFPQGDYFLWSDIPNNRVFQWIAGREPRVFDHASNNANGHTRDREGRLVSCEHLTRRVTRREHDGSITVIADSHAGRRLNSPNDVVVKSDGTIWFTDPPYGILSDYEGRKAPQEQDACHVFRCDGPGAEPVAVASDFDKPNGLAFSPDERRLYVSDTGLSHDPDGAHHIRVFEVGEDNSLSGGEVFAVIEAGVSDGFRCDTEGNVWTSAATGVLVYSPEAELLGEIRVPEVVSNLCFGGPKGNRLLITATTSAYSIHVAAKGAA